MKKEVNQKKKRRKIPDWIKAGILRWWIAGMCYFFIGFGTQAGAFQDPMDLIFFLGIGLGFATILIFNPIAYGMFDMVRKGKIANQSYYARKGWQNAVLKLAEIFKNLIIVILVYLTYQCVNMVLVQGLELVEGTVVLPGEPFGFATIYLIYYHVLSGLIDTIDMAVHKKGDGV